MGLCGGSSLSLMNIQLRVATASIYHSMVLLLGVVGCHSAASTVKRPGLDYNTGEEVKRRPVLAFAVGTDGVFGSW